MGIDEASPPGPEEYLSLAAMVSALRDGQAADSRQLRTLLISRARSNGATWAQIGALYGISGREAKKKWHTLAAQVGRARRMQDNRGEEGTE